MSIYTCNICNRSYKRKEYYTRHHAVCEILLKSKRERDLENEERDDTPNIRDLYLLVQTLTIKYTKLQEDYTQLKRYVSQTKKKFDIIEFLNTTNNETINNSDNNYDTFINSIELDTEDLELVFNFDYVDGILKILEKLNPPIKAFRERDNVLFAYFKKEKEYEEYQEYQDRDNDNDNDRDNDRDRDNIIENYSWQVLSPPLFNKMINVIAKNIMELFYEWQQENQDKMEQDDFAATYIENVKKVMGGNTPIEVQNKKIMNKFYKTLDKQTNPFY